MNNAFFNGKELLDYLPTIITEMIIKHESNNIQCPFQLELSLIIMSIKITGISCLPCSSNNNEKITAEYLGLILNPIIDKITNITNQYGGEVLTYYNDQLIVLWKCLNNNKHQFAKGSIQCSFILIEDTKDKILGMNIGISYGKGCIGFVGGHNERYEYICYGEAMDKSQKGMKIALDRQVIVNKGLLTLINEFVSNQKIKDDYYKITMNITNEEFIIDKEPLDLSSSEISKSIHKKETIIKGFIPNHIQMLIAEKAIIFNQEIRLMTLESIKVTFKSFPFLEEIQEVVLIIQKCINLTHGIILCINIVDIYSLDIVCGWGNPSNVHYDDPNRAVSSSILLNKSLSFLDINSTIAIASGYVYCSFNTSNNNRKQYHLYGKIVYLVQMLTKISKVNNTICLEEKTHEMIQEHFKCKYECNKLFDGYQTEMNIYSPIPIDNQIPSQYDPFPYIRTHKNNSNELHSDPSSLSLMKSLMILGLSREMKRMQNIMKSVTSQRIKQFLMIKGYMGAGKSLFIRRVLNDFIGKDNHLSSIYLKEQSPITEQPMFLFTSYQTPLITNYPYNAVAFILRQIYLSLTKSKFLSLVPKQIVQMIHDCNCNNKNDIEAIDLILSFYHNKDIDVHSFIDLPKPHCQDYIYPPYKIHNPKHLNNFFMKLIIYYRNYLNTFYKKRISLIFVIEDTHLIDSHSIQFLRDLFGSSSDILNPLIIIMSFQIPFHPRLDSNSKYLIEIDKKLYGKTDLLQAEVNDKETISVLINPIHDIETIQKMLIFHYQNKSIKRIDFKLLRFIISKTFNGNPLLSIQLIDSLINNTKHIQYLPEEIIITSDFNDDLDLLDWQELDIPFLQTKILQQIIDQITLKQLYILKNASIIGTLFDAHILEDSIVWTDNQIISELLIILHDNEVIESLYGDKENHVYKFAIPFLREILLNTIPLTCRYKNHLRIAQKLNELKRVRYMPDLLDIQIINRHLIYSERTIETEIEYKKRFIISNKDKEDEIVNNQSSSSSMMKLNKLNIRMINHFMDKLAYISQGNLETQFTILMDGSIKKKSTHKKEWVKYYGVLTKDYFIYYHSLSDIKEHKDFIDCITLNDVNNVILILNEAPFNGQKNLFSIYTQKTFHTQKTFLHNKEIPERTFFFSCESQEQLSLWVFYLKRLCFNIQLSIIRKVFINPFVFPLSHKTSSGQLKEKNVLSVNRHKQLSSGLKSNQSKEQDEIILLSKSFKKITFSCFIILLGHIQSQLCKDYYNDDTNEDDKLIQIPCHLSRPIKDFFAQFIQINNIHNDKGRRPFSQMNSSSYIEMINKKYSDEDDLDLSSSSNEYKDNNQNQQKLQMKHKPLEKETKLFNDYSNRLSLSSNPPLYQAPTKVYQDQIKKNNNYTQHYQEKEDIDLTQTISKPSYHRKIHSTSFYSDLQSYQNHFNKK